MRKCLAMLLCAFALISFYAYAQGNKAGHARADRNPSQPVSTAPIEQHDTAKFQTKNEHHVDADVKVITLPPKDWQDVATFWINVALAFVGCIGIGIGVCTLIYLRKQAGEMRLQRKVMVRSLRAMREQGERESKTIVLQYRPKVVVRSARATGLGIEPDVPGVCKLEFLLVNLGGSPAHILDGSSVQLWSYTASNVDNIKFVHGSDVQLEKATLEAGQRTTIADLTP